MHSSVDSMCLTELPVTVGSRLPVGSYLGNYGDVTVLNAFV